MKTIAPKKKQFSKVRNKLTRLLTRPVPQKIKRVNFAVTYRCNSRCQMCNIWKKYKEKPESVNEELSYKEIVRIFDNSHCLRSLDELILTGGEPFLRKDLPQIVKYFTSRYPGASIVIPTNGMHTESILDMYQNIFESTACLPILVFSIDGMENCHDTVRGIAGAFSNTIQTIKTLSLKYPDANMGLSLTITKENFHELRHVYSLSREMNVAFTMRFAATCENYYDNAKQERSWTNDEFQSIESDIQKIVLDIKHTRSLLPRVLNPDTYFFSQLVKYQKSPERLFRCYSGTHSLFLDPYGDVFPCMFLDQKIGNIKNSSFDSIWLSSVAENSRKFIAEENCHCWSECEVIPSLQRQLCPWTH